MFSQSLYIHIPFCKSKCLFCSFTIAVGQNHRREEYVDALVREMKKYKGNSLQTIYFGGGTPSELDNDHFDQLMNAVNENFSFEDVEISIEANPEGITLAKAEYLKSKGFNRIS